MMWNEPTMPAAPPSASALGEESTVSGEQSRRASGEIMSGLFHRMEGMSQKKPEGQAGAAHQEDGTKAVRRAAGLLRAIAQTCLGGASLASVSQREGLPRSTAHRILKCLQDEGLVERTSDGRHYCMGPLIHELSLTPISSATDVLHWRHVVEAVARRTGVTSYLMRRSGIEAVCLLKVDGNAVVRFVPVDVGQRRLLGVGAGATALLAALDPARTEEVIGTIAPGLARYPRIDPDSLRAAVKLTRRTGFAISQGTVVDDGFGMGVIVPDPGGTPRLSVSIAAHATTVTESRITAWKKVLVEEIEAGQSPDAVEDR
jgi:DNA-binding IclR family transcriptional regulator